MNIQSLFNNCAQLRTPSVQIPFTKHKLQKHEAFGVQGSTAAPSSYNGKSPKPRAVAPQCRQHRAPLISHFPGNLSGDHYNRQTAPATNRMRWVITAYALSALCYCTCARLSSEHYTLRTACFNKPEHDENISQRDSTACQHNVARLLWARKHLFTALFRTVWPWKQHKRAPSLTHKEPHRWNNVLNHA